MITCLANAGGVAYLNYFNRCGDDFVFFKGFLSNSSRFIEFHTSTFSKVY